MQPRPVILESQYAMNAADGATTERRTRINRPDEGRGRCKGSRVSGRRKDFSQCMQQSTTPSTSNVILHRQERTELSGLGDADSRIATRSIRQCDKALAAHLGPPRSRVGLSEAHIADMRQARAPVFA